MEFPPKNPQETFSTEPLTQQLPPRCYLRCRCFSLSYTVAVGASESYNCPIIFLMLCCKMQMQCVLLCSSSSKQAGSSPWLVPWVLLVPPATRGSPPSEENVSHVACRIILGPPKHVLHLAPSRCHCQHFGNIWSVLNM